MRTFQVMEHTREKAQEVAEKTGKAIGEGSKAIWGKAKGLGKDLKDFSRAGKRTKRYKAPKKRRTQKVGKQ